MDLKELHNKIEDYSKRLGFVGYGAAKIDSVEELRDVYMSYLHNNYNGNMKYLEKNIELRFNPSKLLPEARSIMCFLIPYNRGEELHPESIESSDRRYIKIASYAHGADYHKVVKDRLSRIVQFVEELHPSFRARVFTDSAPVFERYWAVRSGLGFIGKNTFLINKSVGLHTFIGVILCNIDLLYGIPIRSACGNCLKCIDSCPNGALVEPYRLDARRCISYHTIESKDEIAHPSIDIELKDYIYGCDICMTVCPWSNKRSNDFWHDFEPLDSHIKNKKITDLTDEEWLSMTESEFEAVFAGSSMQRAGIEKIKKNILYKNRKR